MFQAKNLEVFREELFYSGKLNPNSYYAILVKVRKGDNYYTVGKKQHSFICKDKESENFERLFDLILVLLDKLFEEYDNEGAEGMEGRQKVGRRGMSNYCAG